MIKSNHSFPSNFIMYVFTEEITEEVDTFPQIASWIAPQLISQSE